MSQLLKRGWWFLLLIAMIAGACRLRFNAEILDLLPPEQPSVEGLKLYQKHFTNARELLITLRAHDAATADRLATSLAERLQQETNLVAGASWQAPWSRHPELLAEMLACLWFNQPPEVFGDLTNRLAPERLPEVLTETREALATSLSPMDIARRAFDPFNLLDLPALNELGGSALGQGQKMFSSSDSSFRVLFVQAGQDLTGYRECLSWLDAIKLTVKQLQQNQPDWNDVEVHFTGRPVFVAEISSSMRHDLSGSITATAIIIGILFWLIHRRWLPLLWLLTLLLLVLIGTIALGGLVLGAISVVSLGFAAVLLGLAVDYAVVHYQEALAHPQMTIPEIRRAIAPSILWAAITTISAFLVLNLGGLPGLAQLGSLVAIGVALAALVMVMIYLPPLFPHRRQAGPNLDARAWWTYFALPHEAMAEPVAIDAVYCRKRLRFTVALVLAAVGVLCLRQPALDRTADALRPQNSEAERALKEITAQMGVSQDVLWLITSGTNESEVSRRLVIAEDALKRAREEGVIGNFQLPALLWPNPENQTANRKTAAWLGQQGSRLREAARSGGFKSNALALTDGLIETWARAGATSGTMWPTNEVSEWLLKKFTARSGEGLFAMGLAYPETGRAREAALARLSSELAKHQVLLSGWSLLGSTTLKRVQDRMWFIVVPMVLLVMFSLWMAFRRGTEILLGLAVMFLSGLSLLAVMALAGWSWNLLNLMAVPLILGTGVDYCLFMQLALRRHGGDVVVVRRSVGRALLLCGGTAIAGFGALGWSSNAGMASLGRVCATGIAANMLIAIFLLPAWWSRVCLDASGRGLNSISHAGASGASPSVPSSFYRARVWRLALFLVRILPASALNLLCVTLAEVYYWLHPARRVAVVNNLLPALNHDRSLAKKTAHALFRQFALKLADLWRFESGILTKTWLTSGTDWSTLEEAGRRGNGVLLLTPHLGNWELGGALLAQRGFKLTVLTQAEPGDDLTELRKRMRERWGIETFVIGGNSFDFVEVIKRLQAGANVALLLDRPPEAKAAAVELFGRPFRASIAAAELARASGCTLIGVVVVRERDGYAARILPEFKYDRAALCNRETRRELTQRIIREFEPEIRRHADQWFHFVPVWPEAGSSANIASIRK